MKNGLKELRELSLADSRRKHPDLPESARSCRNYTDKTSNGLTKCIIDFLRFSGHQAERISNTGRYLDNSKIVIDVLDNSKWIGSGKWIPGSGQKGSADISAVIQGKAIKIEVKMKDRQSPDQKAYQAQIERSGGLYWLVKSFDEFLRFYNEII